MQFKYYITNFNAFHVHILSYTPMLQIIFLSKRSETLIIFISAKKGALLHYYRNPVDCNQFWLFCIHQIIYQYINWHKNMHSKTYSHAVTNYKNVHTFKSLWIIGGFCLCMCCIARDAWKKIWITSLHGRGDPAPFRTEISWPEIRWSTKIRRLVESMIYSRLKHRCPYTLLPKKEKKRDEEIMKRINIFTRY